MKLSVLVILAAAFWLSAFVMFAIGFFIPNFTILRIAAIPDAILALVFTVLAASRWVNDPPR